MPNILALTDKSTGERFEGRGLIGVDEKLCAALGQPVHDIDFYRGWVDWMGLYLTNDWATVRANYQSSDSPERWAIREPILDWLEANYALDGYAMIGR